MSVIALPANDEVHLWTTRLGDANLAELRELLSTEEQAQAARFVRPVDRDMFTLSRGVRRKLVAGYLAHSAADLVFETNDFGKPSIPGLRFSVSHSGDVLLIGVACDRELGVDIEKMRDLEDLHDLAKHSFSPAEQDALLSVPEARRLEAFFACWSRKEAVIKGLGRGLSFPLDAFDVTVDPDAPPRLLASRDPLLRVEHWSLLALEAPEGNRAALFVSGGPVRICHFP